MKVEIWSDVVCPWCYIGKRRFESALEEFGEEVDIIYRSFELSPDAPRREPGTLAESLASKYGISPARAQQMLAQTTQAAADEGLNFDFARAQGGNTFDAHRVLKFALLQGAQPEVKERLLRAYFVEGRAISDRDELAKIAGEAGLDAQEVRTMLDGDEFAEQVRADEARAGRVGVRGVPYFLIDGEVGISGAQPPETFLEALRGVQVRREEMRAAACNEGMCEIPED